MGLEFGRLVHHQNEDQKSTICFWTRNNGTWTNLGGRPQHLHANTKSHGRAHARCDHRRSDKGDHGLQVKQCSHRGRNRDSRVVFQQHECRNRTGNPNPYHNPSPNPNHNPNPNPNPNPNLNPDPNHNEQAKANLDEENRNRRKLAHDHYQWICRCDALHTENEKLREELVVARMWTDSGNEEQQNVAAIEAILEQDALVIKPKQFYFTE
jgi:hypothetical protein